MSAAIERIAQANNSKRSRAEHEPVRSIDPAAVATTLLGYLRRRWQANKLAYLTSPQTIPHGWETYTFWFELRPCAGVPKEFHGPLVLRIYASSVGLANARRESRAENYLRPLGFPVVNCLLLEEDASIFGGPFLISEKAEGELFPEFLYHHPWRILELPRSMGCLHAELHQVPVDRTIAHAESFLDRKLRELDRLLRQYDLTELCPGFRWLERSRPEQTTPAAMLHLDFHPLNLLYGGARGFTVLDWSQVDVGDRHADVAVSKMFMDCMQIERPSLWEQFNFWGGRLLLKWGYQEAYEEHLQLNRETLSYYSAWAAFRRLCLYGAWFRAGPAATGLKPAALAHVTAEHIDSFRRYFEEHSGVAIHFRPFETRQLRPGASNSRLASEAILG
jgi:aminoglycoside phosphotransferase (APT) family kinase protein